MIAFAFGVAAVFAALMGTSYALDPTLRWYGDGDIALLVARTILAPALAAWIAVELVNIVRPLRLFDRRISHLVRRAAAGVAAGVLGALGATAAFVYTEGLVHEVVTLASAGAAGSVLVLALMRRIRRGECIYCRYDQRDQPAPGRSGWGICPECGAAVASRRARAA